MEILAALQGVLNLAQGLNNTKLTQEIINLQQNVLKVVTENNDFLKANLKLQSEIEELKSKLEIKEKIRFDGKAYWLGEDGPFCVKCYDTNKKLCRIIEDESYLKMKCASCDYTYQTESQRDEELKSLESMSYIY